MNPTPFAAPDRCKIAMLVLALAITVPPGLVHPRTAAMHGVGIAVDAGLQRYAETISTQQLRCQLDTLIDTIMAELVQFDRTNIKDGQHGSPEPANRDGASRLDSAVADIKTAWKQQDIRALARHVRRDTPVAVYLKGKYVYSLDGNNYLSMTRDAFIVTKTVAFVINKVQATGKGLTTISGDRTYTDRDRKSYLERVSYTLKQVDHDYYITEIDTATEQKPDLGPTDQQKAETVFSNPGVRDSVTLSATQQNNGKSSPLPTLQQRALAVPGVHAFPYDYHALHYWMSGSEWDNYFPSHIVHYPHYYVHYFFGVTAYSPYYYYDGIFAPFIGTVSVINQPPRTAYAPYPLYTTNGALQREHDGTTQGPPGANTIADAIEHDPLLANAISDIVTAWNQQDVRFLARHIERDDPLAVYFRGKYAYSLDGGDYLNITRDAFSARVNVHFVLESVERKADGVTAVNGRHVYTDHEGNNHTVLVSYVLHKMDDDYYLIQIGMAPRQLER